MALEAARKVTRGVAQALARRSSDPERHPVAAFDLATSAAELAAAEAAGDFAIGLSRDGRPGELEEDLASAFLADAVVALRARVAARSTEIGVDPAVWGVLDRPETRSFVEESLSARATDRIVDGLSERRPAPGLTDDQSAFAEAFRQFARDVVAPRAEEIHRRDRLVPPEIVDGLKRMGAFGLSIPQKFGGIQSDERPDNMGMVVVTEQLSRASLAAAGSLITRPEILAKALLKGGTDAQKAAWLPRLASGETMVAVAVTEPDVGSDVAGLKVTATRTGDHGGGWRLNGAKTWCTFAGFADALMVLARTDPDPAKRHRGLSLFIVEKPSFEGHEFRAVQGGDGGRFAGSGTLTGRAIPTIGYRGMHSFELSFQDWFVPAANLVGGEGQGFYLQMEGFAGGRLQTAARALGVMQASFDEAFRYARERRLFGRAEIELGLIRHKLARMAAALHACRQSTYRAARRVDEGDGGFESSLVKLFAGRAAEWVTREAMQIHGGMGYAEEFPVSRYFLDARVLSIFEGAEEVLALRVVARELIERAAEAAA